MGTKLNKGKVAYTLIFAAILSVAHTTNTQAQEQNQKNVVSQNLKDEQKEQTPKETKSIKQIIRCNDLDNNNLSEISEDFTELPSISVEEKVTKDSKTYQIVPNKTLVSIKDSEGEKKGTLEAELGTKINTYTDLIKNINVLNSELNAQHDTSNIESITIDFMYDLVKDESINKSIDQITNYLDNNGKVLKTETEVVKANTTFKVKDEISVDGKKYQLILDKTKISMIIAKPGQAEVKETQLLSDLAKSINESNAQLKDPKNYSVGSVANLTELINYLNQSLNVEHDQQTFVKSINLDYYYKLVETKPNENNQVEVDSTNNNQKQPQTLATKKVDNKKVMSNATANNATSNKLPKTGSFELVMASIVSVFALISASLKKFVK